ncbi:UNVERIFIED_CONTAM: hypothetical protein Scaly_0809500 [Sesamum calycinum]|uniref:Uncharacterized protein n=1 Tax=Sesamum calycinum TaxID=2727403 RepID=A0AAW2RAB7_9LAMI
MLEKIGLPPKPSLRGSSWVVDASHCQGCSSQFTFINRKVSRIRPVYWFHCFTNSVAVKFVPTLSTTAGGVGAYSVTAVPSKEWSYADKVEGSDIVRNPSLDQPTRILTELESATPEELREQALVEKQKYKTLKLKESLTKP